MAFAAAMLLYAHPSSAQISYGGKPWSFTREASPTPLATNGLSIDMEKVHEEDRTIDFGFHRVTAPIQVDFTLDNAGHWTVLPNGDRIWRMKVHAEGALSLHAIFEEFWIPKGAKFFVYTEDRSKLLGAYTQDNCLESRLFAHELVKTQTLIYEYNEPAAAKGMGVIRFRSFDYGYRSQKWDEEDQKEVIRTYGAMGFGDSEGCHIPINCDEGDDWQNHKRAVARIFLNSGTGGGWCTGALINNTAEDARPLFLSAFHCQMSGNVNNQLTTFYFNYEGAGCNRPSSEPSSQTIMGYTDLAKCQGSDFWLMELSQNLPASYQPYYLGWDRQGLTSSSSTSNGVGIHHPAGDIKMISEYNGAITSEGTDFQDLGRLNNLWYGLVTAGGMEGGSSGSPLLSSEGLILGQLVGGSGTCSNSQRESFYGKIAVSWATCGAGSAQQLQDHLDPLGLDPNKLASFDPTAAADELFISEIVDGTDGDGTVPRFVELFNSSSSKIYNLRDFELRVRRENGTQQTITFQNGETISPGEAFVIATDSTQANWSSFYPEASAPDKVSNLVNTDGNDSYILRNTLISKDIDIYGQPGTDGTGTFWDYTDSHVMRRSFVHKNNEGQFSEDNFYQWEVVPYAGSTATPGEHTSFVATRDLQVSAISYPSNTQNASVCFNEISPTVTVTNVGNGQVSGFTVEVAYRADGATAFETISVEVNRPLAVGASTEVNFADFSSAFPADTAAMYDLMAYTKAPNGLDEQVPWNDTTSLSFQTDGEPGLGAVLYIRPGDNGGNIVWLMRDNNDEVIASGGPFTNGQTDIIERRLCLDFGGCYELEISNPQGGGMPNGFAEIINVGGDTILSRDQVASFNTRTVLPFCSFFPPNTPIMTGYDFNGAARTVTVNWTDESDDETGFEIWRQVLKANILWAVRGQVDANVTSYTDDASDVLIISGAVPEYRVRAVKQLGSSVSYSDFTSVVSGLGDDALSQAIRVYPNPANSDVRISLGTDLGLTQGVQLNVFDIAGRQQNSFELSHQNREWVLNTQQWENGLYNFQLVTEFGTVNYKILIQH